MIGRVLAVWLDLCCELCLLTVHMNNSGAEILTNMTIYPLII
jgi:hypothetical protein